MVRREIKNGKLKVDKNLVAENFIDYMRNKKGPLKYWRGSFSYWNTTHYIQLSDDEAKVYLAKSMASLFSDLEAEGVEYEVTRELKIGEIFSIAKALVHIPEEIQADSVLGKKDHPPYLSTASGVILFNQDNGSSDYRVVPHSEKFWTNRSIPHQLVKSDAKVFQEFLSSVLPDEEDRLLVQEIFGYCLLPDNRFQKAFIFIGEGANGKSVLLLLLRLVLGEKNVGSLPLDAIDPNRTFPLATLVGKLANISEDLNEVDKVSEGMFKMMVAGETILVERKYKDPIEYPVSVKQIYSSNNYPKFSDKSNGVLRRLVILPFGKKFAENEQRIEFTRKSFWKATGELPAILDWAVVGLKRLLAQQGFTISPNVNNAKKEFKTESNPSITFMEDHLQAEAHAEVASSEIYESYSLWASQQGLKPLPNISFSKEIKRNFPSAVLSKNPRAVPGRAHKSRVWFGIKMSTSH